MSAATLRSVTVRPQQAAGFARPASADLQFVDLASPDGSNGYTGAVFADYSGHQGVSLVLARDGGYVSTFGTLAPAPTCAVGQRAAAGLVAVDLGHFTAQCSGGTCVATAPDATAVIGPVAGTFEPSGVQPADGVVCAFRPIDFNTVTAS